MKGANAWINFALAAAGETTDEQQEYSPHKPAASRSRATASKRARQAPSNENPAIPAHDLAPIDDTPATDADASQLGDSSHTQELGRATRPQNKFRRPALDVGLDWKTAQREREATTAAKANKKVENERKKAEKIERTNLRKSGLAHIAQLEEARRQRDRDEDEYLNVTATRRAYLASSTAGGTRGTISARNESREQGSVGSSGSEFEDEEESSSSESSAQETEDGTPPQKKVCLILSTAYLRI